MAENFKNTFSSLHELPHQETTTEVANPNFVEILRTLHFQTSQPEEKKS